MHQIVFRPRSHCGSLQRSPDPLAVLGDGLGDRTRATPERLRGVITTRRYTNPRLSYLTLLWGPGKFEKGIAEFAGLENDGLKMTDWKVTVLTDRKMPDWKMTNWKSKT